MSPAAGQSKTLNNVRTAVNTEAGNEKVFHRVSFQGGLTISGHSGSVPAPVETSLSPAPGKA
jgi:hypothetical protein